jgi:hypothetical protein
MPYHLWPPLQRQDWVSGRRQDMIDHDMVDQGSIDRGSVDQGSVITISR